MLKDFWLEVSKFLAEHYKYDSIYCTNEIKKMYDKYIDELKIKDYNFLSNMKDYKERK